MPRSHGVCADGEARPDVINEIAIEELDCIAMIIDYHDVHCKGNTLPECAFADGLLKTFDGYTDVTELPDHDVSCLPLAVHTFGHTVNCHDEDREIRKVCVECCTEESMTLVSCEIAADEHDDVMAESK